MRKTVSRFAAGVIAALMAATAIPSAADGGMNTERAMAGMSVALNNYYASSITAEGIGDILNDIALQRELEAQTETEETETETEPETEPEETQAPQPPSPYSNVAIAQVANEDGYVNVRTQPSTEGEIVGKIYNNCAATILETVAGENGDWYRIQSGSVEGYIKAEFFITGADAEPVSYTHLRAHET